MTTGASYRVLRAVAVSTSQIPFQVGEIVKFRRVDYSRYDGCHIYHFDTDTGVKSYWLHDDEPLESLIEAFLIQRDVRF
ncbi:hypothetical protein ACEWB4_13845 [Sphingobium sp. sgz301303]|uniref:hypothetical protein n=1 Tax=Sphingobium sp. sgz301304 TaxID=3341828 RepID=UPI0035A684ED